MGPFTNSFVMKYYRLFCMLLKKDIQSYSTSGQYKDIILLLW